MREMKESGYEWLGEIPATWTLKKGKYLFSQRNTKGNAINLQLLSPTQHFGVIPQEMLEELTTANVVKVKDDTDLATFKTIHEGDFCISLRSFQGGFEYSPYEGVVSPAYQVFYATEPLCNGYYKYLFKDRNFIDKMNSYTMSLRDGKNIAFDDFGNTYIPIPPIEEQELIAGYLDTQSAKITKASEGIQCEIETLEQYKRSMIIEIVISGLSDGVSRKESGISWVGLIPEHWNVHPVYYYFGERKHKNIDGAETNLLSLSYGNVVRKDINTTDGLLPASFNTYNIVEQNDIIIRPTDLQNDKKSLRTGLVKERGIITSAYIALQPMKRLSSRYFRYLLHAFDLMKVFYNMGNGVRQGLNFPEFSKLMVIEPPFDEQEEIADYLDARVNEIDLIIEKKRQQLDVLADMRRSIIFECVTGKKEIPR